MNHTNENHALVVASLKAVAKKLNKSFSQVKKDFIACDLELTFMFWEHFYSKNPYKTVGVDYCHTCRQFTLEFVQPLVPWSLEKQIIPDGAVIH